MDEQLKQRLVGAAVLVLLAVIFIPMILDQPPEPAPRLTATPAPAKSDESFSSRIFPLDAPETPLVDEQQTRRAVEPMVSASAAAREGETSGSANASDAGSDKSTAASSGGGSSGAVAIGPTAWAVQLGSFSSSQNAVALRDRLRKKGYTAFVEKAESRGSEVTRVFVGPALAREQADEVVKKLYAETKLKGIVVRYPGS